MERRDRAIQWLAFAPEPLYRRYPAIVPDLLWELVSEKRFGWNASMGQGWTEIIHKAHNWTTGTNALKMCADAIQYSFNHTDLPIGSVVAAAFSTVYRAVCESQSTPPELSSLFSWYDWDKAKELRKSLVNAFLASDWNPADLALAAKLDEELLRKIVKRVLRANDGELYLARMLNELSLLPENDVCRTKQVVQGLAADPDFYEPWD
jgi:hypothetical protein